MSYYLHIFFSDKRKTHIHQVCFNWTVLAMLFKADWTQALKVPAFFPLNARVDYFRRSSKLRCDLLIEETDTAKAQWLILCLHVWTKDLLKLAQVKKSTFGQLNPTLSKTYLLLKCKFPPKRKQTDK